MLHPARKKAIFGIIITCFLLLIFFFVLWPVKPTTDNLILELGDTASEEIQTYLYGFPLSTCFATLDLSQVNPQVAGAYPAYVTHGFDTFHYTIHVIDTTAPTLSPRTDRIYLAAGQRYELHEFFNEVFDLSGEVTFTYKDSLGMIRNSFLTNTTGKDTIEVYGTDKYGNTTFCKIKINVDTPPEFHGIKDYYIANGSDYDLLKTISAWDDVDGDLTSRIESNIQSVNPDKDGDYPVHLSVSDQYGLTTNATINVHIASADAIQELINTHQIHRNQFGIIGAPNPYDGGILDTEDIQDALKHYKPAFVSITTETKTIRSRGSGYIASIGDNEIILFTNHHVVENNAPYNVEFYDGTSVPCEIIATTKEKLGASDMALLSVDLKDVPAELLDHLMTVHINEGYWKSLKNHASLPLGIYVHGDSLKMRSDDMLTGELVQIHGTDKGIEAGGAATLHTIAAYAGTSGSAMIDGHGNLIAMISCASHHRNGTSEYTNYWGVPLDRLLSFYKEHIGKDLNYQ